MSRTKKTGTKIRGGRVAVIGALGLASVTLAAAPAFAKGGVDITAPHTAHAGQTFTVTAHGDDDAAVYLRVCLEGRSGGQAWHRVTCGAVVATGTEAQATAHVKAAHSGVLEYRAVVYGLTSPTDGQPVRERTSGLATVNVR
ncbi:MULTISPECIES: hypothetical protein [Actinomycetes]|uniref:hypothetical protein n=1 Tax=Actinomycetes TaxID=1760 RepID=UPI0005EC94E5|nr:hypothetical protein [Saccharothrix sp. ST-888]KJK55060.1 hypothetical protein UK12_31025 [Saccharothrix sp. ST-888]